MEKFLPETEQNKPALSGDEKVKVSFVVTLFNKAAYLPYVWKALSEQTGDFEKEYIFVDDGSTDETFETITALAGNKANVKIIRQSNQGPSVALNVGFGAATGVYIKPMDGDDILLPWATEQMLAVFQSSSAVMVLSNHTDYHFSLTETFEEILHASPKKKPVSWHVVPDFLRQSLRIPQTSPSFWMATRQALQAVEGCDEGVFIQDYSLELRLGHYGAVAQMDNVLTVVAQDVPGRMSSNGAQTLHDVTLAAMRFVEQNPDLSCDLRRYILKRSSGCSWLWARRRLGCGRFSKEFLYFVLSRMGLLRYRPALNSFFCSPFVKTDKIRQQTSSKLEN